MKNLLGLFVVLLVGCASTPSSTQPRALGLGALQPMCFLFCWATNTQSDAESGSSQQATTTTNQSATTTLGPKP